MSVKQQKKKFYWAYLGCDTQEAADRYKKDSWSEVLAVREAKTWM